MRVPIRAALALLLVIAFAAAPRADRQGSTQNPPAQNPPAQNPPAQNPPAQNPPAQPQGQQPPVRTAQPPVIRSRVNFVSVDVIVTNGKSGEPVLDLKQEDFDIREDGKPQKVEQFQVIRLDNVAQAEQPAPRDILSSYDEEREAQRPDVRLFVLFLDDYHVRRGNDLSVRKPLIDFIERQLGPNDMMAVMYPLTPVTALTFTRNHGSAISAIEKFEGRKYNYEPRNEFEDRYAYYPAQTVENIRNEVSLSALKGAAIKMGGMREGRKSIILISEGFSSTLPPQLADPSAAMPGFNNPYRGRAGVDLPNDPRVDSAKFFNSVNLIDMLREVFDTANRNNTSLYAVDPRGLAPFEYDVSQGVGLQTDRQSLNESLDTLRVLADNTDGRAIVNRNDLAAGMKQIIKDSSGYYLLGYTSAAAPTDGKFHKIEVRLTGRHSGFDVRARKGYWAYTAEEAAAATAPPKPGPPPAVTTALNAIAEPIRGRAARFWVGTARGENGRTKVTFVWEPIPAAPGDHREAADMPVRVALTATAPDGRPLFRGRVPDGDAASTAPGINGAPPADPSAAGAGATFEAAPGPLQLRMMVEGAHGQIVDSTTQDVTVPDFTSVQLSLSTPRVYRTRTARELQQIKNQPDARPTPGRDFSRTERLLVRLEAYAPGDAVPQMSAKLLNRGGNAMADLPVQPAGGQTFQIDLPLASLAGGEYLLQVNAKTDAGSAQQLVAFKVGS
jgi:VWFA-related protein